MQRGNMTQGSEWKHLVKFSLPLLIGNILQQLYNTVDGIIVGNFVGEDALSAVGTCAPMTMVFVALSIGMSAGCSIVIAQYFGAGKHEEMRRAAATSMIILISLGIVLSVVGVLAARPLLTYALNVNPAYIDYAVEYFAIYAAGLVFQFAYNICAAILRALGDSKASLYFLLISSVTNVVLDLVFVVSFHWEVVGAAVATLISQALSAVVAMIYMLRRHEILRFGKGEFRFHPASAVLAMRLALPTTMQQCVISCGNLVLQRLINSFDAIYPGLTGGVTAGLRIENFILIPILCINTSLATFTGQNIGAGKLERVKKGRQAAMIMGLIIAVVVGGLALIFRGQLVSAFGVGEQALGYGKFYLAVLCPSMILFSLNLTTNGVMQGAGDVMFNALVSLSNFTIRCILSYTLAYFTPLEYRAVWFSIPVVWLFGMYLGWTRYYSGKWQTKGISHIKT